MKTSAEVIEGLEAALADPDLRGEYRAHVRLALDYMRTGKPNKFGPVCSSADSLRVSAALSRNNCRPDADAIWRAFLAVNEVCHPAEAERSAPNLADALRTVAEDALGYLLSLPEEYRPDESWLAPLRDTIRAARGEI